MKVVLVTIGSRGDVQPFVALAQGLQRAGFQVVLGGPPDFVSLAEAYGVPFTAIGAGIHPISPHVLPRPADWPPHLHLVGYWFLGPPPGWSPPESLVRFLEAGEPPVYVGFGSMPNQDPRATFDLIVRALKVSGQRGVIYGGWGGLAGETAGDRALVIEGVPHEWLFPRMKAVVHHGGAGTTAAGLRAGVPNVVVPFFGDQPFWGWRVAALGAGPAPIPLGSLTAERLAAAIERAMTDPAMRGRASEIGARLRAENGVANTVVELFVDGRLGARLSRSSPGCSRWLSPASTG